MRNISPKGGISNLNITELAAAIQCMQVGVTIVDRALSVRFWNEAFCHLLDISRDLMRPGVTLEDIFRFNALRGDYGTGDPDQQVTERMELARQLQPHHFVRTRPNGAILDITGSVIHDDRGGMAGFVTIYQDVTLEKRHEQHLKAANRELLVVYGDLRQAQIRSVEIETDRHKVYLGAVRDDLTNLFNRYCLEDTARSLIGSQGRKTSTGFGLLLFDVDHFKDINRAYGLLGGDVVLRRVGALLASELGDKGLAARFGADEFAVLFAGVGERERNAFAERFGAAVAAIRFEQTMSTLTLTVSTASVEHQPGESFQDLLARAELALHEEKRSAFD
jgi:diguanylate cyclase (GGDEF)-like protein